jgi:molecular chaperone GrpE (heat shock protein)
MSRRRDEKIAKVAERLAAVLDELEAAIAALPEEYRAALAGPVEPAESDEGETLDAPG